MFAAGKVPPTIGNTCAMPAAHAGDHECDCGQKDSQEYIYDSYEGPWCFCQDPEHSEKRAQYCTPPKYVPEQINVQIAAADTVVVGFVTYEDGNSTNERPVVEFGPVGGKMATVQGISHRYAPPNRSNTTTPTSYSARYAYPYTMSYVKLGPLKPRTQYTYKVKSGAAQAVWSDTFTFKSLYSDGVTRLATYGDMGHSHYNSMDNMRQDCAEGRVDAIVHMGDHAYNIGFSDDRRGDAYMNAFQRTLSTCPWFPIIGNHEASDGDHYKHYEAIAYGESYGQTGLPPPALRSSATSALGHHLSAGTFYSMGLHGATVPSNTSRFVSANVGLIHMVGLDLNNLDKEQLAWLDQDLAHAHNNREAVPWIMVMSHFPIVSSKITKRTLSLEHYLQDENRRDYSLYAEGMDYVPCEDDDEECLAFTVQHFQANNRAALQPLFKKYKVDIYNAGHVHSYESTWPVCDFTKGQICNGKQDFMDPQGPVHITEGNGGVPGVNRYFTVSNCTQPGGYCRVKANGGAYARITAYNATTLTYEHVQNNGGNVTDTWTIVQHDHSGQFDQMA